MQVYTYTPFPAFLRGRMSNLGHSTCMFVSMPTSVLQATKHLSFFILLIVMFSACGSNEGAEQPKYDPRDTTAVGKKIQEISLRIKDDPENTDLLHERAKLHMSRGDVANALLDMEKVIGRDTTKADYFLTLADVHLAATKPGRSKAALEKCLSLDPGNKLAYEKLAELYFIAQQYKEAIKNLDEVLKLDITNPKAYFMKGMCFRDIGDTTRAISSFQTCIEQDARHYNANLQLAMIHHARGQEVAQQYYDAALRIDPKSTDALYGRGLWFQENRRDYNSAIRDYTSAITFNPKAAQAHFALGFIHYQYLQVYDQAILHFNDAIQADPNWPEAWFNRGLSYEAKGDIAGAGKDYQKALELNPRYVNAQNALQRVGAPGR